MAKPTNEAKLKAKRVKEKFDLISQYLNEIEKELKIKSEEGEPNVKTIAVDFGKIQSNFLELSFLLDIYKGD